MLVIKELSLYITKDLRVLLEDFNFSLNEGQKVALIGEEGNGKSTLLKAIADPDSIKSYVEVKGNIYKSNEIIGYLPQVISPMIMEQSTNDYFNQSMDWNIFDYNLFHNLVQEMEFPEDRISDSITIGQLSGGEKIKFILLCELMKVPTVLLLDEPSNDLDLDSVLWLEKFIKDIKIPIMFVSHDEVLLENCANTIIHIEQLMRKKKPQYTIAGLSYSEYIEERDERIIRQAQLADKEKEEFDKKMERYRHVYQRVHHELKGVSRQEPSVGKNLKDKMASVKAMGRRFEKEKENLTQRPDFEDSILVRFNDGIFIPNGKLILDFSLDSLLVGDKVLSKNINLQIFGPKKICIVGNNGAGKTTLLRRILESLKQTNIPHGYMPQDYTEMMTQKENAIDFLAKSNHKDELTRVRTYLGSMNFTKEEMYHPMEELSGGQRAKLYFSKIILDKAEVLVLDEPTRNLSPLSGPEIRQALHNYGGCIIAVSHDRKFISEVFDEIFILNNGGLYKP